MKNSVFLNSLVKARNENKMSIETIGEAKVTSLKNVPYVTCRVFNKENNKSFGVFNAYGVKSPASVKNAVIKFKAETKVSKKGTEYCTAVIDIAGAQFPCNMYNAVTSDVSELL